MDKFDLYGLEPIIFIDGKKKVKTAVGLSVSILVFVTAACSLWFFSKEMIFREQPLVVSSSFNIEDPPEFSLTKDNFFMAVRLNLSNPNMQLDSTYFSIRSVVLITTVDSTGKMAWDRKDLNLRPCNEVEPNILVDSFKSLPSSNIYCLDEDEITIQGSYGKPIWASLAVFVDKCTDRPDCKSEEEVAETFKDSYLGVFMADYSFDPSSYNKPFQPYMKNFFTTLDPTVTKDFTVDISVQEIVSDTGFMFESTESQKAYSIHQIDTKQQNRPTNTFVHLNTRLGNLFHQHKRTYLKVQNVGANFGGILKLLVLAGKLLCSWFTNNFYFAMLANWIFPDQKSKVRNVPVADTLGASSVSTNKISVLPNKAAQIKDINSLDLVSHLFCRNKPKVKRLMQLKSNYGKYVYSRFDIKTFAKHLNEWSLAKQILFSKDQSKLLTYCASLDNYSKLEEESFFNDRIVSKASPKLRDELEKSIHNCKSSINLKDTCLIEALGLS